MHAETTHTRPSTQTVNTNYWKYDKACHNENIAQYCKNYTSKAV